MKRLSDKSFFLCGDSGILLPSSCCSNSILTVRYNKLSNLSEQLSDCVTGGAMRGLRVAKKIIRSLFTHTFITSDIQNVASLI